MSVKTAIVTGSTKGIGRALAEALLARGVNVVISAPDAAEAQSCAASIPTSDARAIGLGCDVASREQLDRLWQVASDAFGAVDIWVNNAGLALTGEAVSTLGETEFRQMLDINLVGTLLGCQVAIAGMHKHGGAIYNMLGAGADGMPVPRMAGYATSKAAVTFLTRSLAAELQGGPILVGALSPGLVITEGFLREHARTAAADRPAREKIVNIMGDHPATTGAWAARIVDTNVRHGRVFTWLTKAKIRHRAAQQPPRDVLSSYQDPL
jgi:NAD(P)-dependent dehydrogenase (short-subunit alcohol dehydrogenase family)